MTNEEAARILDPETSREALAGIECYGGFCGMDAMIEAANEACRIAAEVLRQIPPANIEREAWEPCGNCKPSCGNCIDGYEDEEDYPLTCQCCVNHNNYRPKDNYCSACGRPLKSEAWAELEKRLRG